jgi:hypothetical protein
MHKLSYKQNPSEEVFNPTSPSYDDSALSSFHHHNAKKYYKNKEKQMDKFSVLNTNNLMNSKENFSSNENFFKRDTSNNKIQIEQYETYPENLSNRKHSHEIHPTSSKVL